MKRKRRKICGCRNRAGTHKNQYATYDDALAQLLTARYRGAGHTIYPCPRRDGVWHIATVLPT